MAAEFNIKNGFISNNNSIVQGTLTATTIVATTYLNLPYSGSASGTTNYLSKFTGTNSIGNSLIYDDGTNIGIGKTNPGVKFDVVGDIRATGYFYGTAAQVNNIQTNGQNLSIKGVGSTLVTIDQTSGNVGIGTTSPTGKLDILDTTLAGSGALSGSALNIAQTWNTTGAPTAIKLNVTNTASLNGNLIDLQISGVSQFFVNASSVYSQTSMTSPIFRASTNATMFFGNQNISTQTKYVDMATGTLTQLSGINSAVSISPIYNQVTSTASNTDLKVNRTETSVGSGTQLLMDLQVSGVSKFNVNTLGTTTIANGIIVAGGSTLNLRGQLAGGSGYVTSIQSYNTINGSNVEQGYLSLGGGSNYAPTTWTSAVFNALSIAPIINQTGTANGITRGIYINPTLSAATDFRAIETTQGKVIFSSTLSATTNLAQGVTINPTLVATANNDTLIALGINPTFTLGSYSGVSQFALSVTGNAIFNNILYVTQGLRSFNDCTLSTSNTIYGIVFQVGSTNYLRCFGTSGNIAIQSGGTFTDISSAKLQINSTTQGVLLPRMTTAQINAIVSPVQGLTVFNTDLNTLCFYTTSWQKVTNTAM